MSKLNENLKNKVDKIFLEYIEESVPKKDKQILRWSFLHHYCSNFLAQCLIGLEKKYLDKDFNISLHDLKVTLLHDVYGTIKKHHGDHLFIPRCETYFEHCPKEYINLK